MSDHHLQSQDVSFRFREMLEMAIKPLKRDSEKTPVQVQDQVMECLHKSRGRRKKTLERST
jgi:hypothetical protein